MFSSKDIGKFTVSAIVGCLASYMFIKETLPKPEILAYCLFNQTNSNAFNYGCLVFSIIEGFLLACGTIGFGILGVRATDTDTIDNSRYGFTS